MNEIIDIIKTGDRPRLELAIVTSGAVYYIRKWTAAVSLATPSGGVIASVSTKNGLVIASPGLILFTRDRYVAGIYDELVPTFSGQPIEPAGSE